MGRLARIVVPGLAHHVTQRGNRREDVFIRDEDREMYLALLSKYAQKHGIEILAYCLMSNHVHLVAVPKKEESLAETLRDTHTTYALRFNKREQLSGHLWQGRFYSCILDDVHLWAAIRYVEMNPVRAGIVGRAEDYAWSSAAAHCGLGSPIRAGGRAGGNALLSKTFTLTDQIPARAGGKDWRTWLLDENEKETELIRKRTRTGRPCGSVQFVERLEKTLKRLLSPAKRGRKPKRKERDSK